MSLTFELDPELTPELYAGIRKLWVDVTNVGGAVGFVPPVTEEDIEPDVERCFQTTAAGRSRLLVARAEDDRPVGMAVLSRSEHRLKSHWCLVTTVMLHPDQQGGGRGRELMAVAEEFARAMDGVEGLLLTCRGGLGLEHFYASCGYQEVGRVPGAIKVAEDDRRDDITMWLPLR